MFEQIIYTSCCKGRNLRDGQPVTGRAGLQVYSFTRELLNREERLDLEEILQPRLAWYADSIGTARGYAYSLLDNGDGVWTGSRESNPANDSRTCLFAQGFVGPFRVPAAFNMGAASNWLTDADISQREGMNDSVYKVDHFNVDDAPEPDFLPVLPELPSVGDLAGRMAILARRTDRAQIAKKLQMIVRWVIENANTNNVLVVVAPSRRDAPKRGDWDDENYTEENVTEAQAVIESIMWMVSYILPAVAAVKLPFTVGMKAAWLRQNNRNGKYRVNVTADPEATGLASMDDTEVLDWVDPQSKLELVWNQGSLDRWIGQAAEGNGKGIEDYHRFCEGLEGVQASRLLVELAEICNGVNDGGMTGVSDERMKSWLSTLEHLDRSGCKRDLRKKIVQALYGDYAAVVDEDMRNGFATLVEMNGVSERYDGMLYDDALKTVRERMHMLLADTGADCSKSFGAIMRLKNRIPAMFKVLQGDVLTMLNATMATPLSQVPENSPERADRLDLMLYSQEWPGMTTKLGFIEDMMQDQTALDEEQVRLMLYESALYSLAVNDEQSMSNGNAVKLYQAYDPDPVRVMGLLERFVRRCEPPEAGVKLLYANLVKMVKQGNLGPNPKVYQAIRAILPEEIENLIKGWLNADPHGTLRLCVTQMNDSELDYIYRRCINFDNPEIVRDMISMVPEDYTVTMEYLRHNLTERIDATDLCHPDSALLALWAQLAGRDRGLPVNPRVALMELTGAMMQKIGDPDALAQEIGRWKKRYHGKKNDVDPKGLAAAIDISYFDGMVNEFHQVMRMMQSLVKDEISKMSIGAKKGGLFARGPQALPDGMAKLIDLCMTLFVNQSTVVQSGDPSTAHTPSTVLDFWLWELPDVLWESAGDHRVLVLEHLVNEWFSKLEQKLKGQLAYPVQTNVRQVRNSLTVRLGSTQRTTVQEWKWVMDQARGIAKRQNDDCFVDFIDKVSEKRKVPEKKEVRPTSAGKPVITPDKKQPERPQQGPEAKPKARPAQEEKKPSGLGDLFGKLKRGLFGGGNDEE